MYVHTHTHIRFLIIHFLLLTVLSFIFVAGGTIACNITNLIMYMIAKDNLPLSIVENEGFQRFMKIITPLYKVPSRKTITKLLDAKYMNF